MAETRGLKALENWAKRVTSGYNGVNVTDMSSSFRDGLAFCAIIHHYYPDLIDFDSLSKENILHNNSLAFSTAEKQLGVPALLDAEDMVNYAVPDRLSIITYLSQLHNCFENQNRVNKVRPAVKRVLKEGQSGPPSKFPLSESKNSTTRSYETCQVCKHRVFILQRLMVSGKLYHRTCFRCFKCDAILNPGAYVESDNSGCYECSICPRDEKKRELELSTENNSQTLQEMNNSEEISEKTVPCVSPIPKPKLPVLSSTFSAARNVFLQESIENKHSHDSGHDISPSSKSSSSDSLSASSGHEALATSSQNLDSGFKDEGVSEDVSSEIPNHLNGDVKFKKSLPSTPIRSLSLKSSDTEPVYKPYQSVFTRELLHTTSLKSLTSRGVSPQNSEASLSGLKTPPVIKTTTEMPLIRSMSYTSALATNTYSAYRDFKGTVLPEKMKKYDSGNNLADTVSVVHDVRLRSGSLEEHESQNIREKNLDKEDSKLKYSSDSDLVGDTVETRYSSNNHKLNNEVSNVAKFKMSSIKEPKGEIKPTTSVKHLIQLREASIQDSKISDSTYKSGFKNRNSLQNTISSPEMKHLLNEPELSKESLDGKQFQSPEESSNSICNIIKDDVDSLKDSNSSNDLPKLVVDSVTTDEKAKNDISDALSRDVSSSGAINATTVNLEKPSEVNKSQIPPCAVVPDTTETDITYPDDLNPFGDDDEEETKDKPESKQMSSSSYPDSLNPFGDSDEDDAKVTVPVSRNKDYDESKNPFASDDEEDHDPYTSRPPSIFRTSAKPPVPTTQSSILIKSPQCQTPSPKLSNGESPSGSVRGTLKKRPAPKPPHVKEIFPNTSVDSDTSFTMLDTSLSPNKPSPSPKLRKNKRAPPPPPSPSPLNKDAKDMANIRLKSSDVSTSPKIADQKSLSNGNQDSQWKKKKRPAPPVPIPRRREIKKIPIHQITAEMNEIEEKQMDLEKHGRDLEVLIRDRDKDEEPTVEEEEYIMQLFELVNQKNALFRRQAELMYIKRSQRLEEEQVELEYQIRCLMSKPASQKTDEDNALEEKLVQQLLDVVDQRNEIIDSIEMDRRREAEEDVSVQEQMEIKNGDLPIAAEIKEKSEHKKEKKHKEKKKKKKKKGKEEKEEKEDSKDDLDSASKKGTIRRKWF